jgi:hypothetical protein
VVELDLGDDGGTAGEDQQGKAEEGAHGLRGDLVSGLDAAGLSRLM